MPPLKPIAVSLLLAAATLVASRATQDEKLVLKREFKAEPKTLKFKTTHAETFVVEGDPKASLKFHGDSTLEVAVAAAEPGAFALKTGYAGQTLNWWGGVEKDPFRSSAATAKTSFPDLKTRLTKERVIDSPFGAPNSLGADWYDAKEAVVRRLAASVSAGDGPWSTQTRLNLAFPPLPAEPIAKGARFDADYIAGYLGQEAQVQVFYTSVVESWNDKTAMLRQSGRAQLVKFEKPASRRSDAWTFEVVQDQSTFSAAVEIDRADGAVAKREGELTIVFKATDGARPGTPPALVTAKMWTKIERLAN